MKWGGGGEHTWKLKLSAVSNVHVVVQFHPWFNFYIPLFYGDYNSLPENINRRKYKYVCDIIMKCMQTLHNYISYIFVFSFVLAGINGVLMVI